MRAKVPVLMLLLAACGLPRDPDGTLERVRGGTLRVGVVHNPPWASLPRPGEAAGVEARLVRALAAEMGARVEWVPGGASALRGELEHRQLDLVIGGLSAADPWGPKLAFTRPYYTDSVALGVRPGISVDVSLRGARVGVERGRAGAAELEGRRGIPVPVPDLATFDGPVAAPTWKLRQVGRMPTGLVFREEPRVFAAPPGENGWLARVERFLDGRRDSVGAMLRSER